MEIQEQEKQKLLKEICMQFSCNGEYKHISKSPQYYAFQHSWLSSDCGTKVIFFKVNFNPLTISLMCNLGVNANYTQRILKIVSFFNKQSRIPNFKIFYNPDNGNLTCKCIFMVSPSIFIHHQPLCEQITAILQYYKESLQKIHHQLDLCAVQRNPKTRNKEKQKMFGNGNKRIDNLRAFISNQIKRRRVNYTLKPLEQSFECSLLSHKQGKNILENKVLSEEQMQKIEQAILIKCKKMNEKAKKEAAILRMIKIEQKKQDKTWDHHLTNSSELHRFFIKIKVFNLSINDQTNIHMMKMMQNKKQQEMIQKLKTEKQKEQLLMSSEEESSPKEVKKQDQSIDTILVQKTPTLEGEQSYHAEVVILKYLKDKFSEQIASYYVQEIKSIDHVPTCLYVDYYKTDLMGQIKGLKNKLRVITHLALGIAFLNNNFLLHRDLKPSNIMIDDSINPRIIDFGSAHSFCRKFLLQRKFQNPLRTTIKYNLFHHQLPKPLKDAIQIRLYQLHKYFDLYSFGVILHEIMKLDDGSDRKGMDEYIWENLRWVVNHTAIMNPNQRIQPIHLAIFMKELYQLYRQ